MLGMFGVYQHGQHKGIQREERSSLYDIPIRLGVAVRDPSLAPTSYPGKAVVISAAPDRVRIAQPKWRRIGPSGEIDEYVRFLFAPVLNQTHGSCKIAVETAAGENAIDVASAVNLELIDSILFDEIEGDFPEPGIVLWAGKRKSSCIGLKTVLLTKLESLLFGLFIATPWR